MKMITVLLLALFAFSVMAQTQTFDPNDTCKFKKRIIRCGDIVFPNASIPTPQPPPPQPTQGKGEIAVLGCSNSAQAAQGYENESVLDRLMSTKATANGKLGGMTLDKWEKELDTGWDLVAANEPNTGYSSAWIQLCLTRDQHDGSQVTALHKAQIRSVVNKIKSRYSLQANQISISPLQQYPRKHVCGLAGAGIFEFGQNLAAYAKNNLGTVLGPELHIDSVANLKSDGCHLTNSGIRVSGQQLVEWFD